MFSKNIFSERLKALRKKKGITLLEFGSHFNISKQSAQKWEAGINLPTSEKLIEIADYFDVSLDYLVGRSDKPGRR